jgi:hypothetical protein
MHAGQDWDLRSPCRCYDGISFPRKPSIAPSLCTLPALALPGLDSLSRGCCSMRPAVSAAVARSGAPWLRSRRVERVSGARQQGVACAKDVRPHRPQATIRALHSHLYRDVPGSRTDFKYVPVSRINAPLVPRLFAPNQPARPAQAGAGLSGCAWREHCRGGRDRGTNLVQPSRAVRRRLSSRCQVPRGRRSPAYRANVARSPPSGGCLNFARRGVRAGTCVSATARRAGGGMFTRLG